MKKTILTIGAEGGSLDFFKKDLDGVTVYSFEVNEDFKSARELFEFYSQNKNPLLWFYPVEISTEIRSELLPVLLREYKGHGANHFNNLDEWERKLNLKFSEIKPDGHQKFRITPIEKYKKMSYDSIGTNPQFLDSEITTYSDITKLRMELVGIGSVEGNVFLIRGEDGLLKGVFPLDRYDVDCL